MTDYVLPVIAIASSALLITILVIAGIRFKKSILIKRKQILSTETVLGSEPFKRKEDGDLPEQIKNYLAFAQASDDRLLPARVKYSGKTRLKDDLPDWLKMETDQYICSSKPAFSTHSTIRLLGIPLYRIHQWYSGGNSRKQTYLLGAIPLRSLSGNEAAQSSLLHYMAEMAIVPTAFYNEKIAWTPVGEYSVKAEIEDSGIFASGVFHFNKRNEMIRFEAEGAYRISEGKLRKENFSVPKAGYTEINGMNIPTVTGALWHTPVGRILYEKSGIRKIDYLQKPGLSLN